MPRNPPRRVRAGLPRRHRPSDSRTVVPGLSAGALANLRRIEASRPGLYPGLVAQSLVCWKAFAHARAHRGRLADEERGPHGCPDCDDPWEPRHRLEAAIRALPRHHARELRRVVEALDRLC